ncbi:hypothetical protein, partial [Paraburkholderia mimosarum]|uniref:hypothetical protein n=1 Tax=Paraburkholderia mimosarum TaxID=312026 RepID=UPI001ABAC6AA
MSAHDEDLTCWSNAVYRSNDSDNGLVDLFISMCNCSGGGRHRRRGVASERLSERIKEGAALFA